MTDDAGIGQGMFPFPVSPGGPVTRIKAVPSWKCPGIFPSPYRGALRTEDHAVSPTLESLSLTAGDEFVAIKAGGMILIHDSKTIPELNDEKPEIKCHDHEGEHPPGDSDQEGIDKFSHDSGIAGELDERNDGEAELHAEHHLAGQ